MHTFIAINWCVLHYFVSQFHDTWNHCRHFTVRLVKTIIGLSRDTYTKYVTTIDHCLVIHVVYCYKYMYIRVCTKVYFLLTDRKSLNINSIISTWKRSIVMDTCLSKLCVSLFEKLKISSFITLFNVFPYEIVANDITALCCIFDNINLKINRKFLIYQ